MAERIYGHILHMYGETHSRLGASGEISSLGEGAGGSL